MESALDASNRGFRLLQKMGWKQGAGLGKHEQGIVEPIKMKENLVCLGLGKAEEYDAMTEQATKERKKLDAEIIETQEEIQLRLEKAAKDDQIKVDVKAIQAAFFCRDCQKQYKTVKEMENHLSSYDHHHRKRLQDLKKQNVTPEEQDSKRKREQQHEAAMLQKRIELAAAAAAAVATSVPAAAAITTATKPSVESSSGKAAQATTKIGFSFGGKAGKPGAFLGKKLQKKVAMNPVASAFVSPFEQQQEQ